MRALRPVPCSTTLSNIARNCAAVYVETTRCDGRTAGEGERMILGDDHTPSRATVEYTLTICSGVTAMP
jgi:hypothetical protein